MITGPNHEDITHALNVPQDAGDADQPQSDFMKSFKVAQFDYEEEQPEGETPCGSSSYSDCFVTFSYPSILVKLMHHEHRVDDFPAAACLHAVADEPEAADGEQGAEAAPEKEQPPGSGRQFWDGLLKEEHQQAEALALAAMGKVLPPHA
jgi:hypothetical protein